MVVLDGSAAHLIAGGFAGTVGAIVTSPLEVVKTRLQGSVNSWHDNRILSQSPARFGGATPALMKLFRTGAASTVVGSHQHHHHHVQISKPQPVVATQQSMSIYQCLRYIQHTEGFRALFKGLSMTVLGVLPSRAIYFSAYFNGQEMFSQFFSKGSHSNIVLAAAFSSFVSSTVTNPIWPSANPLSVWRCAREVWSTSGLLGFYRGIQASYLGIAETSLHFVMYEHLKRRLIEWSRQGAAADGMELPDHGGVSRADEMVFCTIASMLSKSTVTVACYPHEVLRTRLRQEGSKYTGLVQTVRLVVKEEGFRAMYKGLLTHFVRQIPNTCIVLTTYEGVLHFFRSNGMLL
ncbi:hypothetical protein BOX15_Mlig021522g1 [Macrostomum lignano]|uniref:Mitochondrial carrier protein n=1 Tax=Macrostomum lignano TaxID=282301 RepID=A0A267F6K5_9PLAT|nr:hypothetical protein BOX15_Mlig021522g1 [Macrostomum lignano]